LLVVTRATRLTAPEVAAVVVRVSVTSPRQGQAQRLVMRQHLAALDTAGLVHL
jgi:hypothetical protein